jgi:hypothetical protein
MTSCYSLNIWSTVADTCGEQFFQAQKNPPLAKRVFAVQNRASVLQVTDSILYRFTAGRSYMGTTFSA